MTRSQSPSDRPDTPAGPGAGAEEAGAIELLGLEDALTALDAVLSRLESDGLPLDEAIAIYERGVALAGRCDQLLSAAELRIRQVDADGKESGGLAI